jgi:hypothetical protein
MSMLSALTLLNALADPMSMLQLKPRQWDILIRQGRHADLLARLGAAAQDAGILSRIAPGPRMHMESALNLATRQQRELRWEVEQIALALAPTNVPVVLLKGAAYVLENSRVARGRLVSDVDILVPHGALSSVETALMMGGWISSAKSEYDQRYYRKWMHELPPMQHMHRGTVIDVHHAILPTSSRLHPSSKALFESAKAISGAHEQLKVLAPADMVLHSACHLFHEGDLEQGLRGLIDLDRLFAEYRTEQNFWIDLVPRAKSLELVRPLFYALRYCSVILKTDVPESVQAELDKLTGARPNSLLLGLMDALFLRALLPAHVSVDDKLTPLARWMLYVRGHWLRMPPLLLLIHLAHKLVTPKQKPAV